MSYWVKDTSVVESGREYLVYRSFFRSAADAAEHGYYSKSAWSKQGRSVCDEIADHFVVPGFSRTYRTADDDTIFAYSSMNEYLVAKQNFVSETGCYGCWRVYSVDQTVSDRPGKDVGNTVTSALLVNKSPEETRVCERTKAAVNKKQSKCNNEKSNLCSKESLITTYISSSYDGENHLAAAHKSSGSIDLSSLIDKTRPASELRSITAAPRGKMMVYVPEGFPWCKHPVLEPYRSSVMWFLHKLYERRFVNNQGRVLGKDEFVTMKIEYARKLDPKFRDCIRLLLKLKIVRRTKGYQRGVKSYGYRLADPALRSAKRKRVLLDDSKLARRIEKHRKKEISTRTDRWLHSNLLKLALAEVDESFLTKVAASSYRENGGTVHDKLEAYQYILGRIDNHEHVLTVDEQGRRYSLVTNMRRELRSLLRVDGQSLKQIDISNSQWLFLAIEMRRDGVSCDKYFELCERGELYEHVAAAANEDRAAVKKALTQRALFSGNDARCQRGKIKRAFDRLFPEVAEYLCQVKSCGNGGSQLAKRLQSAESRLVIDGVCGRLRREGRVRFVTPVHDCVIFLPHDENDVLEAMSAEFSRLGVHPALRVKDLAED